MSSKPTQSDQRPHTLGNQTLAQWITLGASLLILLLVVGALTYFYFSGGSPQEPTIEVHPQLDAVREATDAFYVPVEVVNRGVQTASDVTVQFTLTSFDGVSETVPFTIAFLPGGGAVSTVAVFQLDPERGTFSHLLAFSRP